LHEELRGAFVRNRLWTRDACLEKISRLAWDLCVEDKFATAVNVHQLLTPTTAQTSSKKETLKAKQERHLSARCNSNSDWPEQSNLLSNSDNMAGLH